MTETQAEVNARAAVIWAVKHELGDYCQDLAVLVTDIHTHDGETYVSVTIKQDTGILAEMTFRIDDSSDDPNFDPEEDLFKIFVCVYEDTYEPCESYNWQVKNFWIALLEWPSIKSAKG